MAATNEDEDDARELRGLLDAADRVLYGRAGSEEFDDKDSGPRQWDRDVRDARSNLFACVGLGSVFVVLGPGQWPMWLTILIGIGCAAFVPHLWGEYRYELERRRKFREERGLPRIQGRLSKAWETWRNRPLPPEDEFDAIYKRAWVAPGIFVVWVAVVRGWRGASGLVAVATRGVRERWTYQWSLRSARKRGLLQLPPPQRALPPPRDEERLPPGL